MKALYRTFEVSLLGLLAAGLLKLLYATYRWELRVSVLNDVRWPATEARIFSFWHGHQLLFPHLYTARRVEFGRFMSALISEHRDGRIIARAMTYFGIGSVAGSSSRGGKEAMFRLIEQLRQGEHVAITPDGPRGPVHKVKPGLIKIAQRSGAPICLLSAQADRAWRAKSWDGMFLPKPFARVRVVIGPSIQIPAGLNGQQESQFCEQVEQLLQKVALEAGQGLIA